MRRVLVLALAAFAALGAGVATAKPIEPLVVGAERFFRIEWDAARTRDGQPIIQGAVYNEHGQTADRMRLLVEALDGAGQVVGSRLVWVVGTIGPGSRRYFEARLSEPAAAYRVRVFSFDWLRCGDG